MEYSLKLREVDENDEKFLYKLLEERKPITYISHKEMPSYEEHVKFVRSQPYSKWYIIEIDGERVGSIYLTHQNEVGIHLFKAHEDEQRYLNIIKKLIAESTETRFFINISPRNELYINFAKKMGFNLKQYTYERDERGKI